ncbi:nucleotidyltransferase family protein [Argonema antarcticum]|uniref:nucleotidyltransferase family protein n=1 Tax=Argonema antarcticum TaxID=2942763 RepID=UPI00201145A3|nr:nucleotidyltransferase family protein [Argonema antarcticum]MCL1470797.1 nucleotidyltransferase family protein [Argonema antarcticum A004/B2]
MTVAILILAAGSSTRMGTPKQLLPYREHTLLSHTVEVAITSVCHPIIVVLGAYAEQIRPEISQYPIQIIENTRWNQGMSSSIQVGIQALDTVSEKPEAVVITLCDQPFISTQLVNQLVETYFSTEKPIIASEYAGTLGVPALFSSSFFPDLMNLKGAEGAKKVIKNYRNKVFSIPFVEGRVDIDTPEEYKHLQNLIEPNYHCPQGRFVD